MGSGEYFGKYRSVARAFSIASRMRHQVDTTVVHDDDVVAPESGNQTCRHRRGTSLRSWHPQSPLGRSSYCGAGRHEGQRLHARAERCNTLIPGAVPEPHILVLTQSAINTSRAGLSMPCSVSSVGARGPPPLFAFRGLQAFFEGDVVPSKKRESALLLVRTVAEQFDERPFKVRSGRSATRANTAPRRFQRRHTSAARLRRSTLVLAPALQPFNRRTCTDVETLSRLTSRRALISTLRSRVPAGPQNTTLALLTPEKENMSETAPP